MKTKRNLLLTGLLTAFVVFIALAMCSCSLFAGSYELTEFIVNTSGVTTSYEINDEVSFDGLLMSARFSDDSTKTVELDDVKFYLGEEDITDNLSKITESVGEKIVVIEYSTEHGSKSYNLKVTVKEEPVKLTSLATFSAPAFISHFNSSIENAKDDVSATDFESNYYTATSDIYVVGADNAFKFVPDAMDDNANDIQNVIVNTTMKIKVGEDFVALVKTEISERVYEYKYNDVLMAVETASKNEFDFTEDAIDNVFAISVSPDEREYENANSHNAIEFEMKVVDGYNVYTAGELSLMDNSNRPEWDSIKASFGLTGVTTNGIILHDTIAVTKEHIPEAFMYTLSKNYAIKYKLGDKIGAPEDFGLDRTFLWNQYTGKEGEHNEGNPNLYVRDIAKGESFNFYGNYFDLDLSKLPLVASFDAGANPGSYADSANCWYGSDFSNTTFLKIIGDELTKAGDADEETCRFENVAVRGNAETNGLLVTDGTNGYKGNETLVYCGGLIFTKITYVTADVENVRTYKFFVTFFGDYENKIILNKTKVYDSASNAMFVWDNGNVEIKQSCWQRAGGPLILNQHNDWDVNGGTESMATIEISDDSIMEAYVKGSEAWFQSVNATAIVEMFMGLDSLTLSQVDKSMFNEHGKMNLIALVMSDSTDPITAMTAYDVQGRVSYGGVLLDRVIPTTTDMTVGDIVHTILDNPASAQQCPPIFNFGNSFMNVYYYAGAEYGILTPLIETPSKDNGLEGMKSAAKTAQRFVLNYGGLGLMLGLFDHISQN